MENTNSQSTFSIQALRALMVDSPAYADLTDDQKQIIEQHIVKNNKPVLLYLFQRFREEAESLKNSREDLARKVLKQDPIDPQIFKDL